MVVRDENRIPCSWHALAYRKAFTALDNAISDIREISRARERVPETIERSNATLGAVERTTERLQTETGTIVATTGIDDDDDDYYFDDTNEEGADAGTVLAKRIITSLAGERSRKKIVGVIPEDGEGDSNVEGDGDNDGDDNGDGAGNSDCNEDENEKTNEAEEEEEK